MATLPLSYVTPEQYLEYDRNAEYKNEYFFGEIVSMAGGTSRHSRIAVNLIRQLGNRLADGPRGVFNSDLRVCLNQKTTYVYPDVTVACEPLEYVDGRRDTITNPKLVVEVLSPGTVTEDRKKGLSYFKVPSLTDLIFIEQNHVWIEHWYRAPDGGWINNEIEDAEGVLKIDSLKCEVPVAAIYSGLENL